MPKSKLTNIRRPQLYITARGAREQFIRHVRHQVKMADPIYRQGFEADLTAKNPFLFPTELDHAMMHIGLHSRPLTEPEKQELQRLHTELDATEWSRWGHGHHYRCS